ncbi:MAG: ribosomal RNA small subunit methyltransferase A [archaeon]|nr:ribosomal RNA small subunit methyltransferase A [archaeon]
MKRRSLGQHLFVDEKLLNEMVEFADISKKDIVFEFGSGTGNLTEILCNRAKKLISYEIDKDLYKIAKSRLSKFNNLNLIHGDALKSKHNFNRLVSNIPYSKSSEFIEWLRKKYFDRAIVTFQKEFAEKLLSQPGSKDYRAITIIARSSFDIEPLKIVGREAFKPRPKVTSLMLSLKPKKDKIDGAIIPFIKLLFSFRGKKAMNAIKMICEKRGKYYKNILKKFDSEIFQKRVERLTIEESVRIAKELCNL